MRLHRHNGDLRWRYRMREVPPCDSSWRIDIRCRYSINPDDVERSRWTWCVWLEFLENFGGEKARWMPSLIGYSEGATFKHPAPNTVQGHTRDQATAHEIVRAVIADVQKRRAEHEALAQARAAFGQRDEVST